jgi:hypothetical protein
MLVPAVTGIFQTSPDWQSFIVSACITGFFAVALILTSRGELRPLTVKQAFVLTGFSWLALTAFAALPLNFSLIGLTYTDSFFEAMSGSDNNRCNNHNRSGYDAAGNFIMARYVAMVWRHWDYRHGNFSITHAECWRYAAFQARVLR